MSLSLERTRAILAPLPFLHTPPCEYRHIFFHISLGNLLVTLCTNWESSKRIKRLVPNCHWSPSDFPSNRPLCYKKMWWENEVPASSPINWLPTESPLGLPEFPHAHPLKRRSMQGWSWGTNSRYSWAARHTSTVADHLCSMPKTLGSIPSSGGGRVPAKRERLGDPQTSSIKSGI